MVVFEFYGSVYLLGICIGTGEDAWGIGIVM